MAKNKINIDVGLDTKDAMRALGKMDIALASFAANLATGAVAGGLGAMASGLKSIVGLGGEFISSAQVQEDAVNDLNAALIRNGEYTEETSRDMQKFASELQNVTKFGDEAILSQLAFAQSMGATAGQSKEILTAAADMAAALNIDLNSAVRNISKTLGGYAGELGEVIPEMKNLTQEQLQAGAGIDLLAKKFSGAATSQIQTFSGALEQSKNVLGDVGESLGMVVTQSPVAIAAIKGFSAGLSAVNGIINENSEAIREFTDDIITQGITGAVNIAGQSLIFFNNILNGTKNFINFLADGALGALQGIQEFAAGVIDASIRVKEFLGLNTKGLETMQASMEKQIEMTQLARDLNNQEAAERIAQQEQFAETVNEMTEVVNSSIAKELDAVRTKNQEIVKSNIETSLKNKKIKEDALKKNAEIDKNSFFYAKKWEDRTNKEKVEGVRNTFGQIAGLTQSSNSTLFAIGKAGALAQHGVNAAKAVSDALAAAPPPFGAILAGLVGVAMAAQGAKIASSKPPSYANSGFIGGATGISTGVDNSIATVKTGELVLNGNDQREVLEGIKNNALSQGNSGLIQSLLSQPIIVAVDGKEVARATREAVREGFVLA